MKAKVEIDVIPVYWIENWKRDHCEEGSPLDSCMTDMLTDFKREEAVKALEKGGSLDGRNIQTR